MKTFALLLSSLFPSSTLLAQITPEWRALLKPDSSIAIPKLSFDAQGNLIITASGTSSIRDFDFRVGKWKMYNRMLNKRLENCKDWSEFELMDEDHNILNNTANVDSYYTNEMPGLVGTPFEGFVLRLFNPKTKLWSLYGTASTTGVLDPAFVGSFQNGVGHFFGKDILNGKQIVCMFRWDSRNPERPIWSQAFSADNGKTWEWNWFTVLEKIK
jgi:hypothetical protein